MCLHLVETKKKCTVEDISWYTAEAERLKQMWKPGLAFFGFFWPRRGACRILVPGPGIELVPPAVEAQSLNHRITREVPETGKPGLQRHSRTAARGGAGGREVVGKDPR